MLAPEAVPAAVGALAAAGLHHEHDDLWEAAFDAIFREYNRIGGELFGKPEVEEGRTIHKRRGRRKIFGLAFCNSIRNA